MPHQETVRAKKSVFCRKEKRRFWLVMLAYSFSGGVYDIWSSLFDVNLKQYGVSEVSDYLDRH